MKTGELNGCPTIETFKKEPKHAEFLIVVAKRVPGRADHRRADAGRGPRRGRQAGPQGRTSPGQVTPAARPRRLAILRRSPHNRGREGSRPQAEKKPPRVLARRAGFLWHGTASKSPPASSRRSSPACSSPSAWGRCTPSSRVLFRDQTVRDLATQNLTKAQTAGKSLFFPHLLEHLASIVPDRKVYTIIFMFAVITVLSVVGNVFRFFQEYLSDKSAITAINDIRTRLYDQILHLPLPYFGTHGTSDVTSRLVQDAHEPAGRLQDRARPGRRRADQGGVRPGFSGDHRLAADAVHRSSSRR